MVNGVNMTATGVQDVNSDVFMELQKFGTFQYIQYILICLPTVMVAMIHVNYVFVAQDVDHRCLVPKCEEPNPNVTKPVWWPSDIDARCFRPVVDDQKFLENETCSNNTFYDEYEECHEWVYEQDSVVSTFNLGCQSWKISLIGTLHNAGMIVTSLITGLIADKFGRKPTLIICAIGGVVGIVKVFVRNFYFYLGIEFLESVLASGLYTIVVILLTEIGGEGKRVLAGVLFGFSAHFGEGIFGCIALGIKYWKYLILVVYTPMLLFIFHIFFLRESTRWQLLRGNTTGAKESLKLLAKINKLIVTGKQIAEISEEELRLKFNIVEQKEKESLQDILASKDIMIRLAIMSYCFFSSSFAYYGLAINSVLLPGNKYTNFILAAVASFPGDVMSLYMFNKYGRKTTLQCAYVCSAIFLLTHSYISTSIIWLKVLLFLCGKMVVVISMNGIYIYSTECFPTSVRGTLFGICNTAARVGTMLAPLTPLLTTELEALPSLLFTGTAIISAFLLRFTPETMNLPMVDTIKQIEVYKPNVMTHL